MESAAAAAEEVEQWESSTCLLQLHGVFDSAAVLDAVARGDYAVRRGDSEQPLIQIGQNLFVGKWEQPFGTDMLFRQSARVAGENRELTFEAASDRRLVADKAVVAPNANNANASAAPPPQPQTAEAEPTETETLQEPAEAQPSETDTQTQPEPAETEPAMTDTQPEPAETEPAMTDTQPEPAVSTSS